MTIEVNYRPVVSHRHSNFIESRNTIFSSLTFKLMSNNFTGYIDLSKRRVSPEEIKKCEEKFTKAKAVSLINRSLNPLTLRSD